MTGRLWRAWCAFLGHQLITGWRAPGGAYAYCTRCRHEWTART